MNDAAKWGQDMDASKLCENLVFSFLLLCGGPGPIEARPGDDPPIAALEGPNQVTVTILYDNYPFDPRLRTGWGFSCLVQGLEKNILFDTGGDESVLIQNMRQLGIDPASIDLIVLSHIHGDHTGGLRAILVESRDAVVYLPASFPGSFKEAVRSFGAGVVEVSGPQEISAGVFTTGEMGSGIREQAMALKTGEGLVIITGCAHPGVVNMVRKAKEMSGEGWVDLVLGGFHLGGEPIGRLESIVGELRQLSVRKVGPCHCSGDVTRRIFRERYGAGYIDIGVGKRIVIKGHQTGN
jgi:7,8-dihydropterin-6-yl-methyl-4-(beta-D-ribofuranosyl)aminobenzene 5'-phosphate synthase